MNKFRIRLNRLEITALVSGFVLMVFELAGARILAPGIGSSTYVWTSVIGIIIAALSVGYWVGGKVADKRGYPIDVARLALLTALAITLTILQYETTIAWVADTFDDPRWQGVMASLLLFAPASLLLGTMSPYLAKLNVRSLHTTGRSVASLSALNSIGGIAGTFIAGFVLFGYIGSHETLVLVAILMVAVSWLIVPGVEWRTRALISASVIVVIGLSSPIDNAIAIDTPSARYTIYDFANIRVLQTGPYGAQSGISLIDPRELVFWYTQQMAAIVDQAPKRDNILVLGGGAFTLPQYLAQKYPDAQIDAVEIDPHLADIAREHFRYNDPANVRLEFADARTYVNRTDKKYDVILVDVYGETHIPFTLLSREYGDQINRILAPQGIVAVNMIAGFKGECRTLLVAMDAPYRKRLPYASYTIENPERQRSNLVAAYSREPVAWPGSQFLKLPGAPLYADNFAPAERLQHDCRRD